MAKKKLVKYNLNELSIWFFRIPLIGKVFFILEYELEKAMSKMEEEINQFLKEDMVNPPIEFLTKIPVSKILNEVEDFVNFKDNQKLPDNKIKTKGSFICSLKLASDKFITSKKDRDYINKVLEKIEKKK